MTLEQTKTTKERLINIASRSATLEESQALLQQMQDSSIRGVNPATALALYLIADLYSEDSGDQANLNRITTNLETVADDLLTMSRLMKNL